MCIDMGTQQQLGLLESKERYKEMDGAGCGQKCVEGERWTC
jgi:hypothetical protein